MPTELNHERGHQLHLPYDDYRRRVLACWLGKAVGGTLGLPVEGQSGPLDLTYYDPVPDCMLPNADLDLQVVWLETLRRFGPPVDRWLLAQGWQQHQAFLPDEYGVAMRNLAIGLMPPISGRYDNDFTGGLGAAIRSELWACLAPGAPDLAMRLAREDACVDHDDEGVFAAEFLAALQCLAFVEQNRERLLDTVSRLIPVHSRVNQVVADTRAWWAEHQDWRKVRIQILQRYGSQNLTDVAQNLGFMILGWYAGDSFGEAICIAVNCGEDTDGTGASLGALLGILDPDSIEERWLTPIGRELRLSPGIVGAHEVDNLDQLTDQVAGAASEILAYYEVPVSFAEAPELPSLPPYRYRQNIPDDGALLATGPLIVTLRYPESIAIHPGDVREFGLVVTNPSQEDLGVTLAMHVPHGWLVDPVGAKLELEPGASATLDLRISAPPANRPCRYRNHLDLIFDLVGMRWTVSAGLVQTIPWLRDDGELLECTGRTIPLIPGQQRLRTQIKVPTDVTCRFIAQAGGRQVSLKVDDHEILAHDSDWTVPAIHRAGDTAADHPITAGWHEVELTVGEGASTSATVSFGDPESWGLLHQLEWRRDPDRC